METQLNWNYKKLFTSSLEENTVYNLVYNYSATSGGELYLNGILQSTDSTTGNISTVGKTYNYFGANGDSWRYWNKDIKNLVIYNRTLSAEEINTNYDILK